MTEAKRGTQRCEEDTAARIHLDHHASSLVG
jgi:hypothetical protein